jgi:predicted phosphohydrolase
MPDVIEEIAEDFRLNIVHYSPSEDVVSKNHAAEVREAAQFMLDLYAHLRQARRERTDLRTFIRAGEDEPNI